MTVPDVLHTVAIRRYFDLLREAVHSYEEQQRDLQSQYIILTKICTLALERLPAHTAFGSFSNKGLRDWCKIETSKCLNALEDVVRKLDEQEDKRITEDAQIDLIDEFDMDDNQGLNGDTGLRIPPIPPTTTSVESMKPKVPIIEDPIIDATQGDMSKTNTSMSWQKAFDKLSEPLEQPHIFDIGNNVPSPPPPFLQGGGVQNNDRAINVMIKDSCILGINREDLIVLKYLDSLDKFHIPLPTRSLLEIKLGRVKVNFIRDDFHISFTPFLRRLPAELQVCRSANEANRCFFLHLGVALSLHPFALQLAFRHLTECVLSNMTSDMEKIVLPSIQEYAGFVDANSLKYLWPREMNRFRVCVISGSVHAPIFSCFAKKGMVYFCLFLISIFTFMICFLYLVLNSH